MPSLNKLFLKISNPKETNPLAIMLLGVSTSRFNEDSIGEFGSGFKHAIAHALREEISVEVCIGLLKMEFFTRPVEVESRTFNQVYCRTKGTQNKTTPTGFTTEYGIQDWTDIRTSLQEFMSNALDGADQDITKVGIEVTDSVRAKQGYTQIYLGMDNPEVYHFSQELEKRYLHFRGLEKTQFIPNNADNTLSTDGKARTAVLYKKGARIGVIDHENKPALFHYNLPGFEVDESRKLSAYNAKSEIALAIRHAPRNILVRFFEAIKNGQEFFEQNLDAWYMQANTEGPAGEKIKEEWHAAWNIVFGEESVACAADNAMAAHAIEQKGLHAIPIPHEQWLAVVKHYGIKSSVDVLDAMERQGRQVVDPTEDVTRVFRSIWNQLEFQYAVLPTNVTEPTLKCFTELQEGGGVCHGLTQDNTIYINKEIAVGNCELLWQTILEQTANHVTRSTIVSPDFANFGFKTLAKIMRDNAT